MNRPEILAPAGSEEALSAALRCGADAIYLGGKQFSARHSAENFDTQALARAARLCHLYGAKLYLTVNTLVFPEEFPMLEMFLQEAAAVGTDALLVQDFGVLELAKQLVPNMPIHASTQMTVHTPEGARWAKEHGLTRVVVARELSESEIAAICRTGIEVEVFAHGALCMSVSGQCGLSAVIGSRSANRGRCAQACRLPFSASSKPHDFALSLKDACLVPHVASLAKIGVDSLKIEGRCKRPEYVAAAVTALRQALDGETPDLDTLRAVFSRSGFTDGYYTGTRKHMFGIRQKEDVLAQKNVLPQLAQLYRKPLQCVPLSMEASVNTGKPAKLTLRDADGNQVTVQGEIVQHAQHKPANAESIQKQLAKLGGTIYTLSVLHAHCDGTGTLPAAAWNALRRDGTAAMNDARIAANTPQYHIASPIPAKPQSPMHHSLRYRIALPKWTAQFSALLEQPDAEALLLPLETVSEAVPTTLRSKIFLVPPRFCADESFIENCLKQAKAMGFSHLVCENVSHIRLGKRLKMQLHGGLGLNVCNSRCLEFLRQESLQDALLSPELTLTQSRNCTGLPIGLYAYGNLPVMTMRNCPIQASVGCKNCRHVLRDRTGRAFPVYCRKAAGIATMYNAVPTWMADKTEKLRHADYLLLDCTLHANAATVLEAYQIGKHATGEITRGLFFRGVE